MRAALPVQHGAWHDEEALCSAVCCPAQSMQHCEAPGTASCRWKGLLVWALVFAGEGRKEVSGGERSEWLNLPGSRTHKLVRETLRCDTNTPFPVL